VSGAADRGAAPTRVVALRFLVRLLVFGTVGTLAAVTIAYLAWHNLPYEAMGRYTPEERFLFWEGSMWLLALAFAFFGLAAMAGTSDMLGRHGVPAIYYGSRADDHALRQMKDDIAGRSLFTNLPWVPWTMLGIAVPLVVLAVVARSQAG
jgi:hypothetical protein